MEPDWTYEGKRLLLDALKAMVSRIEADAECREAGEAMFSAGDAARIYSALVSSPERAAKATEDGVRAGIADAMSKSILSMM